MFIQHCFIRKNTPELRKKLREIGYQGFKGCSLNHDDESDNGECLFVSNGDESLIDSFPIYQALDTRTCEYFNLSEVVDCGTNEDLFLALAALNSENDYMQWFVTEEEQHWINLDRYAPEGSVELCLVQHRNGIVKAHKASVQELIEHFKTNNM